jgi:hypothetical protein
MRKRVAAKVIHRSQDADGPDYRGRTLDRAVAVLLRGGRWRYGGQGARPRPAPAPAPVAIRIVVATREGAVRPKRAP